MRTARSRNSNGYLLGRPMDSIFSGWGASGNPGWLKMTEELEQTRESHTTPTGCHGIHSNTNPLTNAACVVASSSPRRR
jgi:hypothetical protein